MCAIWREIFLYINIDDKWIWLRKLPRNFQILREYEITQYSPISFLLSFLEYPDVKIRALARAFSPVAFEMRRTVRVITYRTLFRDTPRQSRTFPPPPALSFLARQTGLLSCSVQQLHSHPPRISTRGLKQSYHRGSCCTCNLLFFSLGLALAPVPLPHSLIPSSIYFSLSPLFLYRDDLAKGLEIENRRESMYLIFYLISSRFEFALLGYENIYRMSEN